ncbi:MAG TPA: energy transducer TonB [Candidatus Angelobacter sp.]|nr:energy transducer TonB [Candidatus Angelobacter sp.]
MRQTPVVEFEILESGATANGRLKRSSGVKDLDDWAMNWTREAKYKPRPGCGVLKTTMSLTVDFK